MMAASVSVPPVVALPRKTTPSPAPISAPPIAAVRNGSSTTRPVSGIRYSQTEYTTAARKVLRTKGQPRSSTEKRMRGRLRMALPSQTGIPPSKKAEDTVCRMIARPVKPPGVMWAGV